ncbi:MAG: 4Fe-4S binding protein [Fibrobacterota bacterium]
MARKYTRIFQILFFSVFVFLIGLSFYPNHESLPLNIFLKLDPLFFITASLASRELVLPLSVSLGLIVITVFLGRVFCGMMCPLGAYLDFMSIFFRKRKRNAPKNGKWKNSKYLVLAFLIVSSTAGVMLFQYFGPLAISTRTASFAMYPVLKNLYSDFFDLLKGPLSAAGISGAEFIRIQKVFIFGGAGAVFYLVLITAGEFLAPRFWCRYICPTGALLGLFSGRAFYRRRVVENGCINCRACSSICPTGAIPPEEPDNTEVRECILCGKCIDACSRGYNKINFGIPENKSAGPLPDRRTFLKSGAAAAVFSLAARPFPSPSQKEGMLVRPPGSLTENKFKAECMRCGECVRACSTKVLQPSVSGGLTGLWLPEMFFRKAGCDAECNICGHVCPSGAIRPLDSKEKSYAKIGTAFVDSDRCVAYAEGKYCLMCDEVCPYGAIFPEKLGEGENERRVPVISRELCIGCGMCEWACPVEGEAAIRVYNTGEERRDEGSYVDAYRKKLRENPPSSDY